MNGWRKVGNQLAWHDVEFSLAKSGQLRRLFLSEMPAFPAVSESELAYH